MVASQCVRGTQMPVTVGCGGGERKQRLESRGVICGFGSNRKPLGTAGLDKFSLYMNRWLWVAFLAHTWSNVKSSAKYSKNYMFQNA